MKDKGIDKGLVREQDSSARSQRGWSKGFFSFRKMFWDYLNKLHVSFQDPCCPEAPTNPEIAPAGFNTETGEFVFWDSVSETWLTAEDWVATTTTTTTTTTSTTTTTTAASTTTTTTL